MTTTLRRGPRAALLTALLAVALSGCSMLSGDNTDPAAEPSTSTSPTATETPYDSQFTRDGTFQSHIDINGVDFVYTLYPTKSTPRTNEWYPKGNKFFSFTFQAYDLDRGLRDPYKTKRKVYLERIQVTSVTKTTKGRGTTTPYRLDAEARRITFDPEPLTTKYGMIITSPKGAFELRNQKIRPVPLDTRGIDLMFTATVWVQESAGSDRFTKREIKQTVPIAIFESTKPTKVARIPVNAN
ncbi:hypothetical protein [Nocardioides psychrotolerans]|uniref:hypothetical protein n=1 Tax=Nocardioides psychrotolerans TaxID=1005945 RepID=UPI003137BEAA